MRRSIVVPLVIGLPVIMLVTGAALVLGALVAGTDPRALQPPEPRQPAIRKNSGIRNIWIVNQTGASVSLGVSLVTQPMPAM